MTTITDDFNRADSTSLGANWVEVSGDWSIISNQLSSGSAGGTIILRAATAMATSDHSAQVKISATAAVSHGVWCRGNANITSGYLWRNDGSSWNLFSVVGGSFTSIGSFAGAAVAGDVAKVQAVGSTIKGFVNGVERVSVVNTAVATGTSVGLRAESVNTLRFDDFTAADITTGTSLTLTPATETETAQPLTGAKAATIGTASATDTARPLTGSKTGTLPVASTSESAQALTGSKASTLNPAGTTETAQPLTGAKTSPLGPSAADESAQPLTGAKAATPAPATAAEEAQPLTGSKTATLGTDTDTSTAQPLTGTKNAELTSAAEADTAEELAGS